MGRQGRSGPAGEIEVPGHGGRKAIRPGAAAKVAGGQGCAGRHRSRPLADLPGAAGLRRGLHRRGLLHVQPARAGRPRTVVPRIVPSVADGAQRLPHLRRIERLLDQGLQLRRRGARPGVAPFLDRARPRLHPADAAAGAEGESRAVPVRLALEPARVDEGQRLDAGRLHAEELLRTLRGVPGEVPAVVRGGGGRDRRHHDAERSRYGPGREDAGVPVGPGVRNRVCGPASRPAAGEGQERHEDLDPGPQLQPVGPRDLHARAIPKSTGTWTAWRGTAMRARRRP